MSSDSVRNLSGKVKCAWSKWNEMFWPMRHLSQGQDENKSAY